MYILLLWTLITLFFVRSSLRCVVGMPLRWPSPLPAVTVAHLDLIVVELDLCWCLIVIVPGVVRHWLGCCDVSTIPWTTRTCCSVLLTWLTGQCMPNYAYDAHLFLTCHCGYSQFRVIVRGGDAVPGVDNSPLTIDLTAWHSPVINWTLMLLIDHERCCIDADVLLLLPLVGLPAVTRPPILLRPPCIPVDKRALLRDRHYSDLLTVW